MDSLPFPAWDLLPLNAYFGGSHQRSMTVMTSRGCPQRCVFCCDPVIYGHRFRGRSARSVVDEVETLWQTHGVEHVNFYDASFMVDAQRVSEICEEMIRRELPVTWRARARADHITEPLIRLMKRSGCTELAIGVEAGSQELLNTLHKRVDIRSIVDAFRIMHEANLWISAFFMFGTPGESREQSYETIEFAKRLDPDWALFSHATPLPGTELLSATKDQLLSSDWYDFRFNTNSPVVSYGGMSKEEIRTILLDAYRTFYVRKEWLLNRLRKAATDSERTQVIDSFFYYLEMTQPTASENAQWAAGLTRATAAATA